MATKKDKPISLENQFRTNQDFKIFSALMCPDVPVRDTSVKTLMETSQPVLPLEEQYYDNDTPIHIYKSFDFNNMPMDPSALIHARNYVEPIPQSSAPVVEQPVVNQPQTTL